MSQSTGVIDVTDPMQTLLDAVKRAETKGKTDSTVEEEKMLMDIVDRMKHANDNGVELRTIAMTLAILIGGVIQMTTDNLGETMSAVKEVLDQIIRSALDPIREE